MQHDLQNNLFAFFHCRTEKIHFEEQKECFFHFFKGYSIARGFYKTILTYLSVIAICLHFTAYVHILFH